MKTHRNKMVLIALALQLFLLITIIALACGVSVKGQTVVLEMTGYDPYDALRGRYLRLNPPVAKVLLEPASVKRYENKQGRNISVYVILEKEADSVLSRFSHASLDRPDKGVTYIKCTSGYLSTYEGEALVSIYPRINQYYLNEKYARDLEQSIRHDTDLQLSLKVWHGMYVLDGLVVDGQNY